MEPKTKQIGWVESRNTLDLTSNGVKWTDCDDAKSHQYPICLDAKNTDRHYLTRLVDL